MLPVVEFDIDTLLRRGSLDVLRDSALDELAPIALTLHLYELLVLRRLPTAWYSDDMANFMTDAPRITR